MTQAVRLQLSRAAGFWLQAASRASNGLPAVNVARPFLLGNPVIVSATCPAAKPVKRFRWLVVTASQGALMAAVPDDPVRGLALIAWRQRVRQHLATLPPSNVACWCGESEPCHGDVVLELMGRSDLMARWRPKRR